MTDLVVTISEDPPRGGLARRVSLATSSGSDARHQARRPGAARPAHGSDRARSLSSAATAKEKTMSSACAGRLKGSISRRTRGRSAMQSKIIPNLWFDTEAEEAAGFYASVFKGSRIVAVTHYTEAGPGPAGTVMTVEFEVAGQRFVGINGGPQFPFTEAVSFQITCENQDEVDYYWQRLTDGGEEGQCGWLKDRYGLSWQVVPTGMDEVFADPDPERARRVMQAMLGLSKVDLAALRSAADGVRAT
jgi:predicted 3-demethylubiquinone-9 3-methyltransferase (glyoxalase superfamily)